MSAIRKFSEASMMRSRSPQALTLIEALLLMVVISIVAVGAGIGLQAVAKVPAAADSTMAVNSVLVSVVEQTRANLIRNWPATTWGGSNYAFIANGASYTPATGTALGGSYSTPLSGAAPAPVQINGKAYQLILTLAKADPGIGSVQPDFMQLTVVACPIVGGTVDPNSPQRLVTYVAQP
jgi:type II secretory pathway pseudopilin PulG